MLYIFGRMGNEKWINNEWGIHVFYYINLFIFETRIQWLIKINDTISDTRWWWQRHHTL